MKIVEQAILSTDLALYFRKKDRFLDTANKGEIDWQEDQKKERECLWSLSDHIHGQKTLETFITILMPYYLEAPSAKSKKWNYI